MVMFMKGNLEMVLKKVKVQFHGLMEINILDNGSMI